MRTHSPKRKQTKRVMRIGSARRGEDGSVLILALVFIVLFGVIVSMMLNYASSNFGLASGEVTKSHQLYAADGALQYATRQVQLTNGNSCPANMTGSGLNLNSSAMALPSDVSTVNVTCKQYTGPGSNLFGGYALVAGVNVSNAATPVYSANPGGLSCDSLSSDPVGGGTSTFASGSGTCVTYPAGAAPQQWFEGETPDAVTTLNAVFEINAHDILYVGTKTDGTKNPTVWFSDGDEFEDAANLAATPGTTGVEITNTKTSLADVWAADENHVWLVGADNGTPYVWYSTNVPNSETDPTTVTWTNSTPLAAKTLTGIYGTDANNVWAVGTTTAAGNPGAVWYWNGTVWSAATLLTNAKTLVSIHALDATHVWAVGANTAAGNAGTVWFFNGTTWTTGTPLGSSKTVTDIFPLDATHVWAVGQNTAAGNLGTVWFSSDGTTFGSGTTISNAKTLTAVSGTDSTHIWVVGQNTASGNYGTAWMWDGSSWSTTGQTMPPSNPALNDVFAVTDTNGNPAVNAVGLTSTVVRYAPTSGATCSPVLCLAQIMGGPVFNASDLNLAAGLQIGNGHFTQLNASGCPSPVTPPSNLVLATGFNYSCTTTVPSSILNISEPLPTSKPAAAATPTTVTVSGVTGCPSYKVYHPGTYTSSVSLNAHTTNFFESGVYNFEGGWGHLDNGNTLPDDLWLIGGKPSPGDVVTIANSSPCWNTIQNSSYYNAGTGTGVEFIMAQNSWWDVHTVNLELFTRQGGPASEGAQGLSFRDVSGVGSGSVWYSDLSTPGGVNQIFQVDANNHIPNVYVHGGIYAPNHNIVEYNNQQQVTLGPIFANSIEFAYASATTPQLRVSGGSPGNATVVLTATTGQVTVQAFIPFDTSGNMVTDPSKGYTWRVLSPT